MTPGQHVGLRSTHAILGMMLTLVATARVSFTAEPNAGPTPFVVLSAEFTNQVLPLLRIHCLDCHAADVLEGDLDLERFTTITEVRRNTATWQKVAEMIDNREMPPKEAKRMPDEARRGLREWITRYLDAEAHARAGDPGPVVLRRLGNAQYAYTIQDLTGVPLEPTREFPSDSAAGEGFTNTGNALVMSPALLSKYFDAGKSIASHAVLLPDGLRFSPGTTRRDWTDETMAAIRSLYGEFTDSGGGSEVNLQGIVFGTNDGGRLPLQAYLRASLEERESLQAGTRSVESVARERKLSPRYLATVWEILRSAEPSLILDGLRAKWRSARPEDARALAEAFAPWQKALWRFNSVGHIGKVGGPTTWMEPVSPLATRREFRLKVPPPKTGRQVNLDLWAGDAGDGSRNDVVVWENPRFVTPGLADLPLRDLRDHYRILLGRRDRIFLGTTRALAATAEALEASEPAPLATLAEKHHVESDVLRAWFHFLGIGGERDESAALGALLDQKLSSVSGHDFVQGWGRPETPSVIANSSDRAVRVPGNLRAGGVAVHPSPSLRIGVYWRSPFAEKIRVAAKIQHAHPECGNGVSWTLELRRGLLRRRLAGGVSQGAKVIEAGPFEGLNVLPSDIVALIVGPRGGNHACDLTAVDLAISGGGREWDLAPEVAPNLLAGNPHADRHGHPAVWRFATEPDQDERDDTIIPPGSLLARWQEASASEKPALATSFQAMLRAEAPVDNESPDAVLRRRLAALRGPLVSASFEGETTVGDLPSSKESIGLDPGRFGRLPDGRPIDPASIAVRAPDTLRLVLPAELVEGAEFVTTGLLDPRAGAEGSAQLDVFTTPTASPEGLAPGIPVVVTEGSEARHVVESAFDRFRRTFPPALCYVKIVPVDEVVTLTLFYREDELLQRLMLDDERIARLDRLWDALHFVSLDALTLVDAFQQLLEYASQDGDPKQFEPLRKPIMERAAAFRQRQTEAEPRHVEAVLEFAARAYRRPLSETEAIEVRGLYRRLRDEEIPHAEAVRLILARVLVAPAFLYRIEKPPLGDRQAPVSDWELASRLSYFLWSSTPDGLLMARVAAGRLRDPGALDAEVRRMLRDDKVRRLAVEFACQWLHVYEFDSLDEKSERHFPSFVGLRGAMYEETIRFFTDLFQSDASVLSILDADHAFLNQAMAEHYGVPGVSGTDWRRVEGIKRYARGGILGLATTLTKQSGASRTSPILRGNWVSEVLLGERLPRPPKDVPQLPEDEAATEGLTVRQLVERHTSDARCASCHERIDPLGFALEAYDPIGRLRARDLAGRPIDARSRLRDGDSFEGLEGLRSYLLTTRRDAFLNQFCRKLLGFALGRAVMLSDGPLLDEMRKNLEGNGHRFSAAVETIVRSRQFREIRGRDATLESTTTE